MALFIYIYQRLYILFHLFGIGHYSGVQEIIYFSLSYLVSESVAAKHIYCVSLYIAEEQVAIYLVR